MKKPIWIAFGYAIAAMACGVFYREFTKFFDFTGTTTLAVSHVHLFMLGAVIFLAVALFNSKLQLVVRSGKLQLGYKSVLKSLRSGKGRRQSITGDVQRS